MRLQLQGKITSWNDEKGYGFITPISGGSRVFVHIKAFPKQNQRPQINQQVFYSLSKDKQGRVCAADIVHAGKQPTNAKRRIAQISIFICMTLFFIILSALTFHLKTIPSFIIVLYGVASTITFITYAIDKSAAQKSKWRTPEKTLHLMSLFGGWPGALIAQQTLRHKSSKAQFQWVYKFTVVLNIALTAWFLYPRGQELTMTFLQKMLNN